MVREFSHLLSYSVMLIIADVELRSSSESARESRTASVEACRSSGVYTARKSWINYITIESHVILVPTGTRNILRDFI